MTENVLLQIFTPEKTFLNKKVYRVVLPYGKTNLTMIEDRAPTSLVLHSGVLQILDENDQVVESYFIDGGVVDFADNVCKISTLHIIKKSHIDIAQAQEMIEKEPFNASYYEMIAHYLQSFE